MKPSLSILLFSILLGLTLTNISACGQAGNLYVPQPAQQLAH